MSISAVTGTSANDTTGTATSKALSSFNINDGNDIIVAVALDSTASSVTSITDTKGNTYTLKASQNGTGVRTEIWQARNSGAQTSNIITVNFSPAAKVAIAAESYTGTSNSTFIALNRSAWTVPFIDSSFSGSFLGPNVLDGTPSTLWSSANTAFPHEIQLDMGSPQTFTHFQLQSRSDGFDFGLWLTFDVYVSTDGVTWGSAIAHLTGTDVGATGAFQLFSLGGSYTKRYLRFVINTATNNNTASAGEMYVGSNTGPASQNTGTNSGSNNFIEQRVAIQDSNGFAVGALGFVCQSGDTLTAFEGTSRQSSIPAATAVGIALYDNSAPGVSSVPVGTRISTSRNWATAGLELRVSGAVVVPFVIYDGALPIMGVPTTKDERFITAKMPDMDAGFIGLLDVESRNVRDGTKGVAYTTTVVGIGGFTPYTFTVTSGSLPTGLTLHASTGVIDGTPTVVGVSSFTITVTDSHAVTASRAFSITISAAAGGSSIFLG